MTQPKTKAKKEKPFKWKIKEYPPKCKHKWWIGAGIGGISEKGKIIEKGLYICCFKCNKTIKAYHQKGWERR